MARTVFTNANLLDGEHPAKPDAYVVVDGNRITSVGTGRIETTGTDHVVDCAGLTVMPGMTSGHFHSTYLDVTQALTPPLGLERAPAYQAYIAADHAGKALRAGVTSVVGANESFDIDPSLAEAIADGLVLGPRIIPGSRDLITTGDSNDVVPWWYEAQNTGGVRICDGPDEFRKGVREEIKRGAEIVKLFATGGHGVRLSAETSSMSRAELQAAVDAAHGLDRRARAHVACKRGIMDCIEAGVDVIDHGDGLDEECIQALVETGTLLLPSLHLHAFLLEQMGDADMRTGFQSPMGKHFRELADILPLAVESGVTICTGDDYGTAYIPHGTYGGEIGTYVKYAGIPAIEVLRWATVNGGKLVGLPDLGRIEEGYLADIIVVDGDPSVEPAVLADPDNVLKVMRDGVIYVDKRPAA